MTKPLFVSVACLVLGCATAGRDNPAVTDGPNADTPADTTVPPDANSCVTQPCDILTACGCGATETCDIDGNDVMGTACRPVSGTAEDEDGGCSTSSGCKAGLVCLGNPGHCSKYCDDNTDCGQPRGQCIITVNGPNGPVPGIPKTCTSNCDPTNTAAGNCPGGEKCGLAIITVNGADTNIVDCTTRGTRTNGQDCTTNGNADDALCAADHLCVTTGTAHVCRKTCIVGGAGICTSGGCQAFSTPFTVGGFNYGFCPNG